MQQPTVSRPPFPIQVWKALVATTLALALSAPPRDAGAIFGAALVFWSAFPLLLRPAELAHMARPRVHLSTDFGQAPDWVTVVIADPKTRRWFGATQMANVKDPRLCAWLAWYFKRTGSRTRVFPGPRKQLVDTMRGALNLLKIAPGTFSLGSFRAGGATEHFISEKNLGLLQFQGRTPRPYIITYRLGCHSLGAHGCRPTQAYPSIQRLHSSTH